MYRLDRPRVSSLLFSAFLSDDYSLSLNVRRECGLRACKHTVIQPFPSRNLHTTACFQSVPSSRASGILVNF